MIKKCANAYCKFGNKIDTEKDDYVEWRHYIKGEEEESFCFHRDCYKFFLDTEITKKAKEVISYGMQDAMQRFKPMIEKLKEMQDGVQ